MLTQEEIKRVYEDLAAYGKEIDDHNIKLIKSIGKNALRHYKSIIEHLNVHDKIEVVKKPKGENNHEKHGVFKQVYVDQWAVGMEGDSWEGFIYAQFEDDKWLKIPYSC